MLSNREIQTLYDRELRIGFDRPGVRREDIGSVVRYVAPAWAMGMVLFSRLDGEDVERVIDEQIAYFEAAGLNFEWKVHGYDAPPDLRDRLAARGFEVGEPEALLVFDLADAGPELLTPPAHDIRRLTEPGQLGDVRAVLEEVWQEDRLEFIQSLGNDLRATPDSVAVYVAYDGGKPVSSAWLSLETGQFAGLWGGSTLPAYRGRGIYRALLAVRAQEALRRGKRFLTIDASPMSRPIVERRGFRFLTMMYPRLWQRATSTY